MVASASLVDGTIELVRSDTWRMECLEAVFSLGLPDWYAAAGFLRNAIWDALHDKPDRTPLNDIDVVYYDPGIPLQAAEAQEVEIEAALRGLLPEPPWQVRNQPRMHLRNGHSPYRDTEHAIARWQDFATCVGVRIEAADALRIVAPYGLEANWSLRVAPNPLCHYPPALFNERIRAKRWLELWPMLQVEWADES